MGDPLSKKSNIPPPVAPRPKQGEHQKVLPVKQPVVSKV